MDTKAGDSDSSTHSAGNITPKYYSGFTMQDLSKELMKLEPAFVKGGVLVNSTVSGSPAERAGLKRGDVIAAVNNIRVGSSLELVYQLQSSKHENLELELRVYRLEHKFIHKRIFLKRELATVKSSDNIKQVH